MLKYFFMLFFMIPYFCVNWTYTQVMFMVLAFFFISELGTFDYFEGLSVGMGLDLMSYTLILLSIWICGLMLMSGETVMIKNFYKERFIFILIVLLMFLLLSFYTMNLFLFYVFFEGSLVPTFLLILGWGYQSERLQAGIYLLFYTLVSSLPLLMMIMHLYNNMHMLNFYNLSWIKLDFNLIMFLFTYMAFLVKLPMFLVHLWLPKAHVEAPVFGSMILAGVLLKLGGYGILRVSKILYKYIVNYSFFFIILSLIGGVLISLNCLRQSDMKLLIAYSSVSHMGIMLGGIFTFSSWGVSSALTMMLSHGLCSSGLFFLTNVGYERVGSRSLLLSKGMIHLLPKLTLWWFLFCAMNMAAPPSLNLLSEIGLINSLVSWSSFTMISLGLMSFLAAGYSLYLFSFSQHGKCLYSTYSFYTSNIREYTLLWLHWIPLNFLILNSELMLNWL
uniref:NADH-ubiquinone oxidoreductase chain 4 n=1 Tax=Eolachesilla chilensis TaxID=297977 RepID=A0A8K1ZFF1_9NEOP|nr:NADH dehydrogenase subunit 4 [Eolachesilla chilensis]